MAEIVGPVMQLGEWLWTPVKRGMSYIVYYNRNLQSLGLKAEKLEVMQNAHKESVDTAEISGDRIKPEVQAWLIAADNAMTYVRQFNGEAEAGEKCSVGWCPDLKWRYNLGKEASELAATLTKLVEEGRFETLTFEVRRAPEVENLIYTEGFQAFEATRQAMNRVMNALKRDDVTAIGVYGMGGIGKTTLVKQVGAQVCKDGLFDSMIMAVFSQNPMVTQIQDQLIDMLSLDLPEKTEILRAARLRERLLRGKNILIILDDIWEEIDLSIIGLPSLDELGRCGSKVILTTRRLPVCRAMRSDVMIQLNRLSEDDSWNLFVTNANVSFESTNFSEVAKQVARECGGLPVALIAIARALRDRHQLEEWQVAARRLEVSQPASLDDDGRVLRCIKLSYDYLKSADAKSCFLLCCLFPENYDIPTKELIKYALGKGLFRDAASFEEARSRARTVINYLKSSSLLLDSEDSEHVKMHDVIRDMAMLIAASEYGGGFLVKALTRIRIWPRNAYEGHTAISLMQNDIRKLPEGLVCPKLQILLLQYNKNVKEIPETFFESLNELKVLDLSRTGISILPCSLGLRPNLQALYLDSCRSIRNASLLGELKKLEILSLRCSGLVELPEEIGNLARLRMLDLTGSGYIKRIPSNLISRLSGLEELYMKGSFQKWGSTIGEKGQQERSNAGFGEVIGLSYLNILEVDIIDAMCLPENVAFNPSWEKFDINFGGFHDVGHGPLAISRALVLYKSINLFPRWFNSVTQRAQALCYYHWIRDYEIDILVEYEHGNLHRLQTLLINGGFRGVTLMDTTRVQIVHKPVFENLEVLIVENMNLLKKFFAGELPQGSFSNLKQLVVQICAKLLGPLLPSNLWQRLQNLETLTLGGLSELANIWSGPVGNASFCNLQTLEVEDCGKLKYVFTYEVSQSLLQLEKLEVLSCNGLKMIIGPAEATVVNNIIWPKLNQMTLYNLPQLTSFYTGNNQIHFPSLQLVTVEKCPRFPTSTYDFHSKTPVTILTTKYLCGN